LDFDVPLTGADLTPRKKVAKSWMAGKVVAEAGSCKSRAAK
jgi:hypothetical protein